MSENELKRYYTIITDCWQLFKKYSSPVEDERFWLDMLREADALNIKHGQTIFSEKIINTVLNEVEKIYQRGPDHGQVNLSLENKNQYSGAQKIPGG